MIVLSSFFSQCQSREENLTGILNYNQVITTKISNTDLIQIDFSKRKTRYCLVVARSAASAWKSASSFLLVFISLKNTCLISKVAAIWKGQVTLTSFSTQLWPLFNFEKLEVLHASGLKLYTRILSHLTYLNDHVRQLLLEFNCMQDTRSSLSKIIFLYIRVSFRGRESHLPAHKKIYAWNCSPLLGAKCWVCKKVTGSRTVPSRGNIQLQYFHICRVRWLSKFPFLLLLKLVDERWT